MNALVSVCFVVQGEGRQDTQLNPRGIPIFLNGSDDFDRTLCLLSHVVSLDHFAKGALPEEFDDFVYEKKISI